MPSSDTYFWNEIASMLDYAQSQLASFFQPMTLYTLDVLLVAFVTAGLALVLMGLMTGQKHRAPTKREALPSAQPAADLPSLRLAYRNTGDGGRPVVTGVRVVSGIA